MIFNFSAYSESHEPRFGSWDLYCTLELLKSQKEELKSGNGLAYSSPYYELQLTSMLKRVWKKQTEAMRSDPGYSHILKRSFKSKDMSEFNEFADKFIGAGFKQAVEPHALKTIQRAYLHGKHRVLTPGKSVHLKQLDFSDEGALEIIDRDFLYWIGHSYGDVIQNRINKVAQDVINAGYRIEDAAEYFEEELNDVWPKAGNQYWSTLTNAVINTTRSIATISRFDELGFEKYRIVSVIDNHTTELCRRLDGEEFYTSEGMSSIDDCLSAESPDETRSARPYVDYDDETGEFTYSFGGKSETIPGASENLRDALSEIGSVFPPFHYLCRTDVVVVV